MGRLQRFQLEAFVLQLPHQFPHCLFLLLQLPLSSQLQLLQLVAALHLLPQRGFGLREAAAVGFEGFAVLLSCAQFGLGLEELSEGGFQLLGLFLKTLL
jgi:hypothetical protein